MEITKTSESFAKSITISTQNKSIYIYDNSFMVYFSTTSASIEDPISMFRFDVGKFDKDYHSLLKEHSIRELSKIFKKQVLK